MNFEIKEILKDNDELLVYYKDGSFENFDTLPTKVLDYITNLQKENEKLLKICSDYDKQINKLKEDYILLQNASEQYEDKLEARIDKLSRLIIATQDSELIYRLNEIVGDNK